MNILEIRNGLRKLGYSAHIANWDCMDIHQDGNTHYLSHDESENLLLCSLNHPVNLMDYAIRDGLNYWYNF